MSKKCLKIIPVEMVLFKAQEARCSLWWLFNSCCVVFAFGVVHMSDTQHSDLAFPRLEKIYCASDCCWILFICF